MRGLQKPTKKTWGRNKKKKKFESSTRVCGVLRINISDYLIVSEETETNGSNDEVSFSSNVQKRARRVVDASFISLTSNN